VSEKAVHAANGAAGRAHAVPQAMQELVMQGDATRDTTDPGRHWPLVGGLFVSDTDRDWDWEGIRIGKRLHLYCYLRDTVVALAPFELDV
jgi:hypothetical protein